MQTPRTLAVLPHITHYKSGVNRKTYRRFNEFILAFGIEIDGCTGRLYIPSITRCVEYIEDTLIIERYMFQLPNKKFKQYKVRYYGVDRTRKGFVDRCGLVEFHRHYQHLPMDVNDTMEDLIRDILRDHIGTLEEDEPYVREILESSSPGLDPIDFMDHITLPVKEYSSLLQTLKHLVKPVGVLDRNSVRYHQSEVDLESLVPFSIPEKLLGFYDPINLDQYLEHARENNKVAFIEIDDHEIYNLIEEIPVTHFHVHLDGGFNVSVQYGYNQYAHLVPINPVDSAHTVTLFKWIYVYITEYITKHYPEYPTIDNVSIIRSSDHVALLMRSASKVIALGYLDLAVMALCGFTTFLSLEG